MEISYCSKCGKMIPPGGVDEGKRYLLDGETICPKCYRKLPLDEHTGNTMVVSENLTLRPASREPADPDFGPRPRTSKLSIPAAKRRVSTRKLPALARSSDSSRTMAAGPAGRAALWWVAAGALAVGAIAALALHGGGDGRPGPDSGERPPPETGDPGRGGPGPEREADRRLRGQLETAQRFWSENPGDHDEALSRFRQLRTSDASPALARAVDEAVRSVEIDRDLAVQALLAPLMGKAEPLAADGDFDGALAVLAAPAEPPEKLAAALERALEAERNRLTAQAEERLGPALAAAEKLSKEGKPEEGLAELDKIAAVKCTAWDERRTALRERLDKEKATARATAEERLKAEAEQALGTILDGFDSRAASGSFAEAAASVADGKAKLGAAQQAVVSGTLGPLEKLAAGLLAAEGRRRADLGKLAGRDLELAMRDGKPVKGKLLEVLDSALRMEVSKREGDAVIAQPRAVTFKDLAPGELHRLAPQPDPADADGRLAAAVFAMGSGFGSPGREDLDRAGQALAAAGEGPLAARWSKRLEKMKLDLRECAARRDWREQLARLAAAERSDAERRLLLPKFLDAFVRDHAASDFAKAREAEIARLRDAAGGGEGAVRQLFKGQVVKFDPKTLEVELLWDFSSAEELGDFAPVKDQDKNKVKLAGGSCVMESGGRLDCLAVFRQPVRASAPWRLQSGGNFGMRLVAGRDGISMCWNGGTTSLWRGFTIAAAQSRAEAQVSVAGNKVEVTADKKRILGPVPVNWPDLQVSLYSMQARVSFDSLQIAGALDRSWLEAALAKALATQLERAAAAGQDGS